VATFRNGINRLITNLTGVMAGLIILNTITFARYTVSRPNLTSDINMADRIPNGNDTVIGVIDPTTVTVTPDGITGDITADQ
jgi:hypothetical protein